MSALPPRQPQPPQPVQGWQPGPPPGQPPQAPQPPLPVNIYPGAALVATGLAFQGLQSGSLSRSGAVAAWVVGYAHLANPVKLFGVTMIAFYLIGSRATKYKAGTKATLEDGPDASTSAGNRNWIQVLANSLPSLVAALAFRFHDSEFLRPFIAGGESRRLIFAALGHFATCLGDTLASELGILSTTKPVHILTLRSVPPGTNGAVSPLGLAASAAGGAIMGLTMLASLVFDDPATRRVGPRGGLAMVGWGTAAGFLGSLVDSLLGATLQQTKYSTRDGRVLTDYSHRDPLEPGVVIIGPGKDVLSNSAVNFVTACVMSGIGYWVGGW